MREIKFNFIYGIDGEEETYFNKTFSFGEIENGLHVEELCDNPLYYNYSILAKRQFTGLKDKNGKDVYEGDILRIPAKDKWEEINYSAFEVFYHDNDCCDNHIGFQMGRMHNFGSISGGFCGYQFKPETTAKFEIIGNIHEE